MRPPLQIAIILAITDVASALVVALPPGQASRPAVVLRMACDNDCGMSRRTALRSATASLVLGGTWLKGTAARAADKDEVDVESPRAKATATPKAPPPPKPAPAAPTNDYSRAMSDPEDPMGLGIFGCKFWGLQAKRNSASCEAKTEKK